MNRSIIAYDTAELEKTKVLSEAASLHQSKFIYDAQWEQTKQAYATKLYTPSFFVKVLLFILSLLGMSTIIGPIGAILGLVGDSSYQILSLIIGILLLFLTEKVLINNMHHYNSGITEAGIYSSLAFIAFGILGTGQREPIVYALLGLFLSSVAAIRYLNLFALISAIGFFSWIIFLIVTGIGGVIEALMPFIFMSTFGLMYWCCQILQKKLPNVIFENQFVIAKTIALCLFYASGNYFVVCELSIRLMGLALSEHDDIPFAIVFYLLTALVPMAYSYWGIRKKSILFIRVGLLTLALSVVTFKYYFSLGFPVITITITGAILIIVALVFFNYLKQIRGGFTREILLHNKWHSSDLTAFIASQTLGGNKIANTSGSDTLFGGGKFGGAGAGGNW
jgi:hypothetical protein